MKLIWFLGQCCGLHAQRLSVVLLLILASSPVPDTHVQHHKTSDTGTNSISGLFFFNDRERTSGFCCFPHLLCSLNLWENAIGGCPLVTSQGGEAKTN